MLRSGWFSRETPSLILRRSCALAALAMSAGACLILVVAPARGDEAAAGGSVATVPVGFRLTGSHGYQLQVYGVEGREGSGDEVVIRASKRGRAVFYRLPAEVEEGSIRADLGTYGDIAVAFDPIPNGGSSTSEAGCRRHFSSQLGYYEGTIDLRAPGITSVEATKALGDDGLALGELCRSEVEEHPTPGTYLKVVSASGALHLTAREVVAGAVELQVSLSEALEGVTIERTVEGVASASALVHRGLGSATLAPPIPFSGSATIRQRGHQTTWTGDLRVDLPGRMKVGLTGSGIRARLFRITGEPSLP